MELRIYAWQSKVTGKAPGVEIEIEIEIDGGRVMTAMSCIGMNIGLIQLYYVRQSTTIYNMHGCRLPTLP